VAPLTAGTSARDLADFEEHGAFECWVHGRPARRAVIVGMARGSNGAYPPAVTEYDRAVTYRAAVQAFTAHKQRA
jgi:hypothetical protein